MKKIIGLSLISGLAFIPYSYHNNKTFRNVCNVVHAGIQMAYIYKTDDNIYPIEQKHQLASQYLRDALKDNGGLYLKLGQLIATLDVIVPDQYRNTMTSLTRQCRVSPFQEIKQTLEQDLGYPLQVVFSQFNKVPISSASIAQVHKGRLLNGEQVAIKIQHRYLRQNVQNDLSMMWTFVKVAKYLFNEFHYQWLIQQFQKNIYAQLDFKVEASNMKRTSYFLAENNFKDIYVPQLLMSPTKRVLIMQYIHGVHIDEVDKLRQMKINTSRLGYLFSQMIIKMIHKEGFVHADTHSGNLMGRKVKGKDQLVLLDHGLYQQLDKDLLKSYNQFWLGLILNQPKHYQKAGKQLGTTNPTMLRYMVTSKTQEDLSDTNRSIFDLNPTKDREAVKSKAAENHHKIIGVLQELKRQILLLLKVNQFARTIENMLGGRKMGVYQDIAKQCVRNSGFSWWQQYLYFIRMWLAQ